MTHSASSLVGNRHILLENIIFFQFCFAEQTFVCFVVCCASSGTQLPPVLYLMSVGNFLYTQFLHLMLICAFALCLQESKKDHPGKTETAYNLPVIIYIFLMWIILKTFIEFVCFNIASVLCSGFLASRHVVSYLPNQELNAPPTPHTHFLH